MTGGELTESPTEWALSRSGTAVVAVAVVLAGAALVLSRVDVALLALPFVVVAARTRDRRRNGRSSTVAVDLAPPARGDAELEAVLTLTPAPGVDGAALRVSSFGGEAQEIVLAAGARPVTLRLPVLHSGRHEVLRVEHRLLGTDAAVLGGPQGPSSVERIVPVPYAVLANLPLPGRLRGLTGTHESSRPGDGGEFRDVHPFAPGDRLRRIDWKATARRGRFAGDLYVRRTAATSDATVVIVLDSGDDLGEQVASWSPSAGTTTGISSLDLAREAAGSLAAGYLRVGDRVGFQDLAGSDRMIAPGGGQRHLWRLLRAIELTRPSGVRARRRRPPVIPANALVYVLSTFLDEEASRMAELWSGSGHRVIAVDVLPAPGFARATRAERLAHRIVMMNRSDRIRSLQAQGVEILRWQDDGPGDPREARLRTLCRPVLSRPLRGRR
ncbi:DUF58 domain-containing protein [Pseudonocardia sp. MH-G8]|uniref:DUF58 domain-containing protein n=1 Tax=Pseudonocardia sp. MH-G8 TaxID=1854588 RepID=UPI000BA1441C|nr:DUF58 domain-containing protein [Pseudonocardia sp. MH-G8]OZM76505.1 DUF58 domain-containing protein [Pseudonocardia sp. MH-G8]